MNLEKIFARNREVISTNAVEEVLCDSPEIKEIITKWTSSEGWKFEDFATFIKIIGLKTPVKLSDLDEKERSFKCVTARNKEVIISFSFRGWYEGEPKIFIKDGEEKRIYAINSNSKKGNDVPKITLMSRSITRNGKELESFYSAYFCNRTLKIDENHKLIVKINEPERETYYMPDAKVLRNCQKVEEYLLSLDNSLVVGDVYDKLMNLLGFSDDDIAKSNKIMISYKEIIKKEEKTRSKILMKKGKMQEYAVLEDGKTYHVFRNGNWNYISDDGIAICYIKKNERYVFLVIGAEKNIINVNPSEIISTVQARINELLNFVK